MSGELGSLGHQTTIVLVAPLSWTDACQQWQDLDRVELTGVNGSHVRCAQTALQSIEESNVRNLR